MWEGAPDYPDKDIWWSLIERYKVTILYTAPTAIRACMKWGAEYPDKHDLSSLRLLGLGRRADQPEGVALVPQGDRRGALPDRRHLVADRDRQHRDLPACPGVTATKPGSATQPLPGYSAKLVSEDGEPMESGTGLLVLDQPWPSMLRTLYRDDDRFVETYFSPLRPRDLPRRRRGPARRRRLLLDHRAYRRRHQRLRSPAVDRRGGVGARLPRGGGRGRRRRPDATRTPARRSSRS